MSEKNTQTNKKRLKGTVVSDAMDKTVVVRVDQYVPHERYLKYIEKSNRIHAHDPENRFSEGEAVVIEECTPISKKKKFVVVEKANE